MDIKRLNKMSIVELDKAILIEKRKKETANETIKLLEALKVAKGACKTVPETTGLGSGATSGSAGHAVGEVQGGYN